MINKEYLNEEAFQKTNTKVKKIGKLLLIIGVIAMVLGVIFFIIALIGVGSTATKSLELAEIPSMTGIFGSFGLFALGGFLDTVGFGLIIAGGITLLIGNRREITAYTTQQTMPIAQEKIEKMSPSIGKAAGTIAKGIKDGLKDSDK